MATAAAALEFEKVESSHIDSRGYDKARQVIIVRFSDGRQYEYPGCDGKLWKDFQRAKSAGSFLHQQLNKKPYERIDDWK